jgi:hypothetical protein
MGLLVGRVRSMEMVRGQSSHLERGFGVVHETQNDMIVHAETAFAAYLALVRYLSVVQRASALPG